MCVFLCLYGACEGILRQYVSAPRAFSFLFFSVCFRCHSRVLGMLVEAWGGGWRKIEEGAGLCVCVFCSVEHVVGSDDDVVDKKGSAGLARFQQTPANHLLLL